MTPDHELAAMRDAVQQVRDALAGRGRLEEAAGLLMTHAVALDNWLGVSKGHPPADWADAWLYAYTRTDGTIAMRTGVVNGAAH